MAASNALRISHFLLGTALWFGLPGLLETTSIAEPWLSTRYAQNCAGCHAPGRVNLKPVDRRCSLSCQGCHINPNGGGLRSTYGKWNEERWLRSFRIGYQKRDASVSPIGKQHYANYKSSVAPQVDPENEEADSTKKKEDRKKKGKDLKGKEAKEQVEVAIEEVPKEVDKRKPPFPLVLTEQVPPDEKIYDRRDGREFIMSTKEDFENQIPRDDPYRQFTLGKFSGGGSLRWQTVKGLDEEKQWTSFLMSADFGLEYRPIYRDVHFVYESRFLGNPSQKAKKEDMFVSARTRSLYAMVDNLPYNIFVMGGWYLPLFANFSPDHRQLAQKMISFAQSGNPANYGLVYNALTFGTAPNVPYLNLHLIQKRIGDPDDRTAGAAANIGLRFVSLGASINYSYWRTDDNRGVGNETSVQMHSFGAAAMFGNTVTSLEAVSLVRDQLDKDYRRGGVYTLDTYTKIWRENYFTFQMGLGNTNAVLQTGSGQQIRIGARSFVLSGIDLALAYEMSEDKTKTKTDTSKVKGTALTSQVQMYF